MGFNRGEIRVKAPNISVVDRKRGESILECRVMSGAITATMSAHSHLDGRVKVVPRDSLLPTMPGTGSHTRRSTRHDEKIRGFVHLNTYGKNKIKKENRKRIQVIIKGIVLNAVTYVNMPEYSLLL